MTKKLMKNLISSLIFNLDGAISYSIPTLMEHCLCNLLISFALFLEDCKKHILCCKLTNNFFIYSKSHLNQALMSKNSFIQFIYNVMKHNFFCIAIFKCGHVASILLVLLILLTYKYHFRL